MTRSQDRFYIALRTDAYRVDSTSNRRLSSVIDEDLEAGFLSKLLHVRLGRYDFVNTRLSPDQSEAHKRASAKPLWRSNSQRHWQKFFTRSLPPSAHYAPAVPAVKASHSPR